MVEEALEGRLCVVHQFPSKREEVTAGQEVGAWASLTLAIACVGQGRRCHDPQGKEGGNTRTECQKRVTMAHLTDEGCKVQATGRTCFTGRLMGRQCSSIWEGPCDSEEGYQGKSDRGWGIPGPIWQLAGGWQGLSNLEEVARGHWQARKARAHPKDKRCQDSSVCNYENSSMV